MQKSIGLYFLGQLLFPDGVTGGRMYCIERGKEI